MPGDCAALTTSHCHLTGPLRGCKNAIEDGETRDLNHLGFPSPSPDCMALKSDRSSLCEQHLQCHPGLTVQMDQGIPDEVDDTEKKHT